MKLCPKCGGMKSLDNFTLNTRTKDGLRAWCRACTKASNASWRAKNLEKWASYSAKRKAADPEHVLALERARYHANPEKAIAKTRVWQEENPGEFSVNTVRKRCGHALVVPGWADVDAIANVYTTAKDLSEMLGERFVVDHIVPLKSPYVCGLHVHQNLQCITSKENGSKGNKTWPGMWPITAEVQQLVNQGN